MMNELNIEINGIGTLNDTTFLISEDAVFPVITLRVFVKNPREGDRITQLVSKETVRYKLNGRNDLAEGQTVLRNQLSPQEFNLSIDKFLGGDLNVTLNAKGKDRFGNALIFEITPYAGKILAIQPNKEKVRKVLVHPYLSAIVYLKSQFEQFLTDGNPAYVNGFGLYRIAQATVPQIWSWKENAAYANADFEQRKKTAAAYPAELRASNPTLYKNLPDFTEKQVELEALQSYGTGMYFIPKQATITRKWSWIRNPKDDGYADKCLAILADVAQGKFPTGWN